MTRRWLFKTLLVLPWLGLLRLDGWKVTRWERCGPQSWIRWYRYRRDGKAVAVPCLMTNQDVLLNVKDPKTWAALNRALDENARDSAKMLWQQRYGHHRDEAHTLPRA